MVPFTFHTEYSPIVTTQLDTRATYSAMSYTDLLNVLQLGEVQLDPPGGKIRLYVLALSIQIFPKLRGFWVFLNICIYIIHFLSCFVFF